MEQKVEEDLFSKNSVFLGFINSFLAKVIIAEE
jgi:hypothetical protein